MSRRDAELIPNITYRQARKIIRKLKLAIKDLDQGYIGIHKAAAIIYSCADSKGDNEND